MNDEQVSQAHVTSHFPDAEVPARLAVNPRMTTTKMRIQKTWRPARPYVKTELVLSLKKEKTGAVSGAEGVNTGAKEINKRKGQLTSGVDGSTVRRGIRHECGCRGAGALTRIDARVTICSLGNLDIR
jgi:hypothetical protein